MWILSPQFCHPLHAPHRPRGDTVFCGTPITRRRCCRCGHCVTHYCHPCSNVPPSPGGDAYVVDFESSLFVTHVATCPHRPAAVLMLWTLSPPFFVTHVATCPHRPAAMLVLWSSSPPFLSPTCNVPPLPGGDAYVVDFESSIFVTHMATCPHRPAAVLMLWTSSPPFL